MSPPVRGLKCLSPVMCQCKVICSNRTLSLMFGCKPRESSVLTLRRAAESTCVQVPAPRAVEFDISARSASFLFI
ncbi:Discs large 1-like protein [Liparis tanakae]|uniref:Discs large 1-like protein n=1 Tax=Liparis tanakae TaxID=230148 RepID=A0A4Z2DYM3_9TELE|nr:Discs large 1-like protein [Liparis tanakae]